MGIFQQFPYSNFHDYNLDQLIKMMRELDDKMDNFVIDWSKEIEENVAEWLDEHPEATTTVLDGSLTEPKFSESLKILTIKDYVTPQMFGAVGDGITDDTSAFQDAVDAAVDRKLPVALISDYYLTSTINIPNQCTVFSFTEHENKPKIIVDDNIGLLFNCYGVQHYFTNIVIQPRNTVYKNYNAFRFTGNLNHDVDSYLDNVTVAYAEKAVICEGRNLEIRNCLFSHCRYGVNIKIGESTTAVRGIKIEGSRFHGIGEEIEPSTIGTLQPLEMMYTGNSAGILLEADNEIDTTQLSDIVIRNCVSDQGGTFVKGNAQNCLIANNYIMHFYQPAIVIEGPTLASLQPGGSGSWTLVGNFIYGLNGSSVQTPITGIIYDWPDYAVKISHYGRINIASNDFGRQKAIFDLLNAINISVIANIFESITSATPAIFNASDSQIKFIGNISNTSGTVASNAASFPSSNIFLSKSNIGIDVPVRVLSSFHSTEQLPGIADLDHFFIRRVGGNTMFEITKFDQYYASDTHVNVDGTLDYIEITNDYTVNLRRRANDGTTSILSVDMVMLLIND